MVSNQMEDMKKKVNLCCHVWPVADFINGNCPHDLANGQANGLTMTANTNLKEIFLGCTGGWGAFVVCLMRPVWDAKFAFNGHVFVLPL
jgi:hypothetical protein